MTKTTTTVAVGLLALSLAASGAVPAVARPPTPLPAAVSAAADEPAPGGAGQFARAPRPRIAGVVAAGRTVRAVVGAWMPEPESMTYRWRVDGKAIRGATKATFKVPKRFRGRHLTVTATGWRDGVEAKAVTSAKKRVPKPFAKAPRPKITGMAQVGKTLKASRSAWRPKPSRCSWQWKADGAAIPGATSKRFVVKAEQEGAKVTVSVICKKGTRYRSAATSRGVRPFAAPLKTFGHPGNISVESGFAVVGGNIRAVVSFPKGRPIITYQWKLDGKPIPDATGETIMGIPPEWQGRELSVVVTLRRDGYKTITKTHWTNEHERGPSKRPEFRMKPKTVASARHSSLRKHNSDSWKAKGYPAGWYGYCYMGRGYWNGEIREWLNVPC